MASPITFTAQNTTCVIGDNDPAVVKGLPAWSGTDTRGLSQIISCWKLTPRELQEVALTGVVWIGIMGTRQPPVWIAGLNPFDEKLSVAHGDLEKRL